MRYRTPTPHAATQDVKALGRLRTAPGHPVSTAHPSPTRAGKEGRGAGEGVRMASPLRCLCSLTARLGAFQTAQHGAVTWAHGAGGGARHTRPRACNGTRMHLWSLRRERGDHAGGVASQTFISYRVICVVTGARAPQLLRQTRPPTHPDTEAGRQGPGRFSVKVREPTFVTAPSPSLCDSRVPVCD